MPQAPALRSVRPSRPARSVAALGLIGIATLLGLASCGDDKTGLAGEVRIRAFTSDDLRVAAGETTTLRWDVSGAPGVTIEPTLGLQPPVGSAVVRPVATTRYRLLVRSGTDTLEATTTVEVEGGVPVLERFDAAPLTIAPGESTTLTWAVDNVTEVTLEPGLGTQPARGSLALRPDMSTTYRLLARSTIGELTDQVTVEVQSGAQPRVLSFTASAQSIAAGERVTLRWETAAATQVSVSPGVGTNPPTGSVEVTPQQTTVYTLVADGPGGSASASLTITVGAAGDPAILVFRADPPTIAPGGTSRLSWETDNASGVVLEPGLGAQAAKSMIDVRPAQTTTYELTALGASTEVKRQLTVVVGAPDAPAVLSFAASPQAVVRGGSTTLSWTTQNATDVAIEPGVGTGLAPSGSIQATPTQRTTFTLTARGRTGQAVTATLEVAVNDPPATILGFTAQPAALTQGQTARLSWQAQDATQVTLDQGLGAQPPSGGLDVTPMSTTTYRLDASGPGGATSAQVTVSVSPAGAPGIQSFGASPSQLQPGASATLSWATTGATEVRIDNGVGVVSLSGTTTVLPPTTTTYTLTAVGPGGTSTARATVGVSAPNGDQCGTAIPVAGSVTLTGDTRTAVDDLSDVSRCTGFREPGPDQVYAVTLQAGDRVRATGTATWDLALYLLSGCQNPAQSCVAGEDNGNPEIIDYTAATAGTYFLVVDGFQATGGGTYTLEVELNPAPVGNELCAGAVDLGRGGVFRGTTRGARNDYDPTSSGCTGYAAAGPDVAFQVALAAGERLVATLDAPWDSALYVVTDCARVTATCVGGSDAGNPESVSLTAAAAGTYFVVVDGYGANQGDFTLTTVVSPPVQGGDTCANAVAIPTGGGAFMSTTAGLADDYDPPVSCTGYAAAGPDRVYRADLGLGDVLEAAATFAPTLDGALYAVTGCAPLAGCAGSDVGIAGQPESLRLVAESAGPRYLVVDAELASATGTHDLRVTTWTGETCTAAAPLRLGARAERTITTGKANDYSPGGTACTGRAASGEDRVYAVTLRAGDQLRATLTPDAPWDASLYLVSGCSNVTASCLAGSDTAGAESIAPVVQQAGTHYLVVDGFGGSDGRGTLTATIARGDDCRDPYLIPAGGGTFRGTTQGYGATLGTNSSVNSCTGFAQAGSDAVYRLTIGPGQTLDASLTSTWDAALYLVSSCAQSATTCLVGRDAGDPETLRYSTPGTYFLVVDSWRAGASNVGPYTLTVTIR